jgi:hypothetical protein
VSISASVTWRRPLLVMAVSTVAAIAFASPALAVWSVGGTGGADAGALTMPTGATPTASANGSTVTVSWSAATFANGAPVAGYVVDRYSSTGVLQTIGSGCSGVITTLTCAELAVPAGTWTYTDTPVQLSWTGTASAQSNSVQVTS